MIESNSGWSVLPDKRIWKPQKVFFFCDFLRNRMPREDLANREGQTDGTQNITNIFCN